MASVTKSNGFVNRTPLAKVLCHLAVLGKGSTEPGGLAKDAVNTTLQETLVGLQSTDLDAIATVLRSIVSQIDSLLLERQLAEHGFDAVRVSIDKTTTATVAESLMPSSRPDTNIIERGPQPKA